MCCILFKLCVNVVSVWNSLTETQKRERIYKTIRLYQIVVVPVRICLQCISVGEERRQRG
jgi:hypothetical protein